METLIPQSSFDCVETFLYPQNQQAIDLPVLAPSALEQVFLDQQQQQFSSSRLVPDMERMSPDSSMDWNSKMSSSASSTSSSESGSSMPDSSVASVQPDSTTRDLAYDSDAFNSDDSNESFVELQLNPNLLANIQGQQPLSAASPASSETSSASESSENRGQQRIEGFRNNNFGYKFPLPSSPGNQSVSSLDETNDKKSAAKKKSKRLVGNVTFKCELCNYSTKFKEHLASHMNKHKSERKYMCTDCGQTFKWSHSLKRHQRTHRSDHQYSCSVCFKGFSRKDHLTIHENLHKASNETFPCSECGAMFKNKKTLAGHLKTHTAMKAFKCEQCDSAFTRRASLNRHIRAAHARQFIQCPMCPLSFSYKSTLEDHKKAVHNGGKREFECHLCGVPFAVKAYLSKHLVTCKNRADGRSFDCPMCSKSFPTKRHLNDHWKRKHPDISKTSNSYGQTNPIESRTSPKVSAHHQEDGYVSYNRQQNQQPVQGQGTLPGFHQHYQQHQNAPSSGRQNSFKCDLCHALFPNNYALEFHLSVHLPPPHTPSTHLPPVTPQDVPQQLQNQHHLQQQSQQSVIANDLPLSHLPEPQEENVGSLLRSIYSCPDQQMISANVDTNFLGYPNNATDSSQHCVPYTSHVDAVSRASNHDPSLLDYQMLDSLPIDCL